MKVDMRRDGHKLWIGVTGQLDAATSPQFEKQVRENIDGVEELVLDLAKTEYLSSAGLRAVLYTQKTMNEQGSMKVIHVSQSIMDIFVVTGFNGILTFE
jgi:anti-sigma B factor antagonist